MLTDAECEKIFTEKASGAQRDRPELKQLIETVELLEKEGRGFRSLTKAMDTTTSGGKLIFHLFAALSEFERSIIKGRTMARLMAARKLGRKRGRSSALKGEDLVIARALLKDENITVEEVAKQLIVSPATLHRHLPGGRSGIEQEQET